MADANGMPDKNLSNVAEDLAQDPVNAHHAQQLGQKSNDRRHKDAINHDDPVDRQHFKS
ncbi:hypothetical protein [Cohnella caldifontis]|uniref:hypothetical protein n=1 Tax=Cohnella caldifontis TaxID=3027471 RepID=UPI0023EBFECA|nr:hypothetical protein [Cohnella sp. YIM B05605]